MRKHLWMNSAFALATATVLCAAFAQYNPAQAAKVTIRAAGTTARAASGDGFGDFIVRCFFNNNIAPQNPIDNPGSSHDDNLYDFFGNMAGGGAAGDGTTFPNIQSGDPGTTGTAATMEQNQLTTPTNCQDTKDTAGYWVPSPYMVNSAGTATPWQNTNGCSTNCKATGANENFHMRVYYIPNSPSDQEIPDGTIMMTGFPNGCATVRMGFPPPDCSGTNYPVDPDIITYACGANTGAGFGTPVSAWPYNCNHYVNIDSDDSYSDGAVAMVRFPRCWDGSLTGNFPAPNTPPNAQNLPTATVPGYVAPWIVYSTWRNYTGLTARPANDFAYPDSNGNCPTGFTHPVVQLEERIHLLTYGANWGAPSSCTGDSGLDWNSLQNKENSDNQGDNPPNGDSDSDATMTVAPGVFGPWKCVAVNAPNPTSGATTLSFACSHSGDLNCNIALKPGPTGCSSMGGTCYVGAYQPTASPPSYGWETLNGVYWQTWQEAQNTLDDPANGGFDHPGDVGTFGDVMEDCVNGAAANKCPAFIVTSQQIPQQVFGNGSGAP